MRLKRKLSVSRVILTDIVALDYLFEGGLAGNLSLKVLDLSSHFYKMCKYIDRSCLGAGVRRAAHVCALRRTRLSSDDASGW